MCALIGHNTLIQTKKPDDTPPNSIYLLILSNAEHSTGAFTSCMQVYKNNPYFYRI